MSILLTSLLIASASAAAQNTAPAVATPPDIVVEGEKKKQRCRSIKISGSRMPRKVCSTGDNASLLMPGVSDNVGSRGRAVSGAKGETETPGT